MIMTPKEKAIFDRLNDERGEKVSRDELEGVIESEGYSNNVDVHVMNLRRKLPIGMAIVTVRGYGYKMI